MNFKISKSITSIFLLTFMVSCSVSDNIAFSAKGYVYGDIEKIKICSTFLYSTGDNIFFNYKHFDVCESLNVKNGNVDDIIFFRKSRLPNPLENSPFLQILAIDHVKITNAKDNSPIYSGDGNYSNDGSYTFKNLNLSLSFKPL